MILCDFQIKRNKNSFYDATKKFKKIKEKT